MTANKGFVISVVFLFLFPALLSAQEDVSVIEIDTVSDEVIVIESDSSLVAAFTDVEVPHSPQQASLYSAVLPGLGQAYNKQYWKIPIIYAAGAGVIYFLMQYSEDYKTYYKAWADLNDGNEFTNSQEDLYFWNMQGIDEVSTLKGLKDDCRRWRDLDFIILGGVYLANIIDANVSAHFKDYDVDEDLSFDFKPTLLKAPDFSNSIGFRISITF